MWSLLAGLLQNNNASAQAQQQGVNQRMTNDQDAVMQKRQMRQQASDAIGQRQGMNSAGQPLDMASIINGVFAPKKNQQQGGFNMMGVGNGSY